jgi:hypothetical protein
MNKTLIEKFMQNAEVVGLNQSRDIARDSDGRPYVNSRVITLVIFKNEVTKEREEALREEAREAFDGSLVQFCSEEYYAPK